MDIEYPYADGASRRQLLYRLPSTPQPRRLLLIGEAVDCGLIGEGWGGPITTLTRAQVNAFPSLDEARFDAVALPWVVGSKGIDDVRRPNGVQLFRLAHRLLVPGGVVMGHLANIWTLRRITSLRGLVEVTGSLVRRGVIGGASRCKDTLTLAGFAEPECYYVQPNIESPMGLIPCDPRTARAHFLRSVRSARGHHSGPAYAARLMVAFLGLGGLQQSELFFWAKKPC